MTCSIRGKDSDLRAALVIEGETTPRHCDLICRLESKFQHTIRCLQQPDYGNCVTYALDLLETYQPLVTKLQCVGIQTGSEFMHWLVKENHLTELPAIREDGLVCYFREQIWKHIGVAVADGRVSSKWGTYAVFDHMLSEVPADYGDDIRFFVRPNARTSARLLFEFACTTLDLNRIDADGLRAATRIGELF